MPTVIAYPQTVGVRHSWASIEIKFAAQTGTSASTGGGPTIYCTKAKYSRKRNRTLLRVNHPDPVAKTRGSNEYAGEIEMPLAEFNLLQYTLIQLANAQGLNGGYGDVTFSVVVNYSENGLDTITDTLLGCTMDSTDADNAEGTDPTKRVFDCAPLKILFNSQDDLATPLQAPQGG